MALAMAVFILGLLFLGTFSAGRKVLLVTSLSSVAGLFVIWMILFFTIGNGSGVFHKSEKTQAQQCFNADALATKGWRAKSTTCKPQ
jgi:hypothetical protein